MSIYISAGKDKNKYSRYAASVDLHHLNHGFILKYNLKPKDGLNAALTNLKDQNKISTFDIVETDNYTQVQFEISLNQSTENLAEARDVVDSYFAYDEE